MKYYDYEWDLQPNRILLDQELDIDKLGWKFGDCFKVVNRDGRAMLVKMDEVEQFTKGHRVNQNDSISF
jgi:hypothetical protein